MKSLERRNWKKLFVSSHVTCLNFTLLSYLQVEKVRERHEQEYIERQKDGRAAKVIQLISAIR